MGNTSPVFQPRARRATRRAALVPACALVSRMRPSCARSPSELLTQTRCDVGAEREQLEAVIRGLCERQDWPGAATRALEGYGPEVLGFLYGALADEDD